MVNTSLCCNFREKYLFSGSVEYSIKIWDMEKLKIVNTIFAHKNPIWSLAIKGDTLYSGSIKETYIEEK